MTNEQSTTAGRAALSAGTAFVVHVTDNQLEGPESLHGRVEHVRSGEAQRFASVADLASFMRRVLANR